MNLPEIPKILEASEFFKGFDPDDIKKISGLCKIETYKPGQVVFKQGENCKYLYVIAEGHISLERSIDLDERKGNVIIGMLGRGRVLGCWSTLLDQAHNLMSTAVCQKPTKVAAIEGSKLRKIMVSNRELGFNILERLCFLLRDRIQEAYGAMEKI
jgi:CRP-like cAMP-binding protein